METLRYTAGNIRAIENERKSSIADVVVDFSFNTVALLVKKGLFLTTDKEVDEVIEKYLEETDENGDQSNDILSLYTTILEALKKAGFLSRALPTKKMQQDLKETMEAISPTN